MDKKENDFIHQPHDKLIKRMLSSTDVARDILSLYLPEEVIEVVNLNKLELQANSFIDDEHRTSSVDILYKTTFQEKEGYIWILLEHQRQSDYWMPVRIFKYIAVIWDHIRRKSKSEILPLIYPLIIYNGDRPYYHSLNLSDLIESGSGKKLFETLFTKPFCLIDLSIISDESLRQAAKARIRGIALLMALKHVFDNNLQTFYEQTLLALLKKLDADGDSDEVVDILYYLLNTGRFKDRNPILLNLGSDFSKKVEDKMSTGRDYLLEQGRKEGEQAGIMKVVKHLLNEKNLSQKELIESLQRVTGFSIEKLNSLISES